MIRLLCSAALACALLGCGPTVTDICEDLEAACPETGADCVADGEELEELAEDRNCEDVLDDYLSCLDTSTCDWRAECGVERAHIDECVGSLPD